jgi:hypothetical protein
LVENTQENKQIDFEQFSVAIPIMRKWGVENPKNAFDAEKILFDELCFWAIFKNLELEMMIILMMRN